MIIQHKDIDPYNEENWNEDIVEENWCVIRWQFPALSDIIKKNMTELDAKKLFKKLSLNCGDGWTSYEYKRMN